MFMQSDVFFMMTHAGQFYCYISAYVEKLHSILSAASSVSNCWVQYLMHYFCSWPGAFDTRRRRLTESIIYFARYYETLWNADISTKI